MNSQYQNTVTEKLKLLADFIYDERDRSTERSFHHHFDYIEREARRKLDLCERILLGENIDAPQLHVLICDPWTRNIEITMERIKNDPFLPKYISMPIGDYYLNRCNKMTEILLDEFEMFCSRILKCRERNDKNTWIYGMHNHINDCYANNRLGYQDVGVKIEQFREMIYQYFKRTENPLIFYPQVSITRFRAVE